MTYDFAAIEKRWQQYWASHKTFCAINPGDEGFDPDKPRFYILDMFPYPSGVGLHVGHPLGYIATDIVARYQRMTGHNVLHPMGYDAFGLPAEQFAVETGVHPRTTTEKNIANMTRQLQRLGLSYDWDRSLSTTDRDYYRWTQWIFLQMFHAWFDPTQGKARPINELQQMLASGQLYVGLDNELIDPAAEGLDAIEGGSIGASKWHELSADQQQQVIDRQRLAYMDELPVNWCPALGTVLANEEVTNDGRSERGNHPVYKRLLRQWMLRITVYAKRLLEDLEQVNWPEPIKLMQRNWIGRSEGAMVDFSVDESTELIRVFTTRPDTLFGATYMVLAPEHPLVGQFATLAQRSAVDQYRQESANRSEIDRMAEGKNKTGVFTGAYAINPVNSKKIPIWIADYVMMGYGTGAIMAVPGHDHRDHDFATTYDLPITQVVVGDKVDIRNAAWVGEGVAMNSINEEVTIDGLQTPEAKQVITEWLKKRKLGKFHVQYKLRDWIFSRQRYWGEPFPILHGPDGRILPVDESQLPVELPELDDFSPKASDDPDALPQPPLSHAPNSWKYVEVNGVKYTREFNTMPQWAGSCWYYLRYIDPHNNDRFVGKQAERYWMQPPAGETPVPGGVDLYIGGAEHAVLHLLYARFWHKVLYDLGHVSTTEPFRRLFNQGNIQAHAYINSRGLYVPADEVEERGDEFFFEGHSVKQQFGKMGKSLKNAVAPDDILDQYGCDTLRLYEMYMGPLDQSKTWRTRDIVGVHRFLQRLWRNLVDKETGQMLVTDDDAPEPLLRLLHRTTKRVLDAMESLAFNVVIAALIELNNELVRLEEVPRQVAEKLLIMLSPLAPHITEELWGKLGHDPSISDQKWPEYNPELLVEEQIEYPVQINGTLRSRITVAVDADDQVIVETALADERVKSTVDTRQVHKTIVVRGRMVNIVVK